MNYDFIVIGAGIAGASVAHELARTARVCLIEGEARPGYHSTGRSAALFTPTYGGREIRALTRASRAFLLHPPAGFCEQPLLLARACLYIARSDQRERLEEMIHEVRTSGGTVANLDARSARRYVPLLRDGYVAEAALDTDAMDIDVDALHQGFLRGARAAGTTVLHGCWVKDIARRDGAWSIDVPGEQVRAPTLINAAGAWADEVAALCGAQPVGLRALRRTAVMVDAPPGVDIRQWPAVIDADEQFYFKPEAGKLLLSPADETPVVPCDVQPEELDVAVAIDRVQAALAIDVRRVSHRWAGLRTFAADRAPVVGYDSHVPGLFWCAGQGGYGIQSAPALARTAAALAQREPVPRDIVEEGFAVDNVSPGRFHVAAPGNAGERR
ncbi:MAG TPA: FAD-dependent oxidoreductase [Steroidobacteraceae bacterium]